ncbi:hypothetical protein [uncultured Legionella sp.]|uniref:hypothetical protein n=1 Tax=uncultured Legionella sp. TaxID=210934 RepID=UPI0026062376|nr:hypothetical protein [uncultured Legionella sp.]
MASEADNQEEWILLGAGNYNDVYRSADRKRVLKIQKNKADTDTPERSVRLWNMINPHMQPPATVIESEHGIGWVCPYVEGVQASDNEISLGLLDIYNSSGRIIVDATAPNNFLRTPQGSVVCIDIGMALQLEDAQPKLAPKMDAHSIISAEAWAKYKGLYNNFFQSEQFGNPQAIKTVKALLFIKEHRPDISDVSFLKNNTDTISQLAKAFDEQNSNQLMAKKMQQLNVAQDFIEQAMNYGEISKAKELLSAERSPTLESVKESCIKELERYINSRGSIYEGTFNPSFMTMIFRDQQLTAHKVSMTLHLINDIKNAKSSEEIHQLIIKACDNDPSLLKGTFSSGLASSLSQCVSIVFADMTNEPMITNQIFN